MSGDSGSGWDYESLVILVGWVTGALTFVISWIWCIASYGFLFGLGLGWLPSAILAVIVGLTCGWLWPVVCVVLVIGLIGFLTLIFSDFFGVNETLALLLSVAVLVGGTLFFRRASRKDVPASADPEEKQRLSENAQLKTDGEIRNVEGVWLPPEGENRT